MEHIILLIDFGSTYTKGTLLNLRKEKVISQVKVRTASKTHLLTSYHELISKLAEGHPVETIGIKETFCCSSAFGGFKMIAIGLTASLTTAAAKKVALGAGTRLLKTYSYTLSAENIEEINQLNPDVILLTGGTDGGNSAFIIQSAKKLAELSADIPIIVAGNAQATLKIKEILSQRTYYLAKNIMPKINLLQPIDTRNQLRQLFFEKIIYAKGLSEIAKLCQGPIIPTPSAVLTAAKLLSQGSGTEKGWGSLAIVDIGGATTDVHSASTSISGLQEVLYEGLPEPFLKRTVEGDLGMRYSAVSLYETAGVDYFSYYSGNDSCEEKIQVACQLREQQPDFIPSDSESRDFDLLMAKIATDIAVQRHVGTIRILRQSHHVNYYQQGKDLRQLKSLIGTGGGIVANSQPKDILEASFQRKADSLKPINPDLYLDHSYLLSALGLLGDYYPETALRLIKKQLLHL